MTNRLLDKKLKQNFLYKVTESNIGRNEAQRALETLKRLINNYVREVIGTIDPEEYPDHRDWTKYPFGEDNCLCHLCFERRHREKLIAEQTKRAAF